MGEDALAVIVNTDSNENEFLMAFRNLGEINERPDFWISIASNLAYKEFHRALCALQLFKRHVTPGMSLGSLSELLGNPNWVKDEDIEIVRALRGEIPVTWTLEDTVFVLRIFPELSEKSGFAIYLRVSGKIDRNSFIKLIRGREVKQRTKDATILEVGFIEPYRHPSP